MSTWERSSTDANSCDSNSSSINTYNENGDDHTTTRRIGDGCYYRRHQVHFLGLSAGIDQCITTLMFPCQKKILRHHLDSIYFATISSLSTTIEIEFWWRNSPNCQCKPLSYNITIFRSSAHSLRSIGSGTQKWRRGVNQKSTRRVAARNPREWLESDFRLAYSANEAFLS